MKKDDSLKDTQKHKALSNPNQSTKTPNFWFCAGLLAILLASILSRDITRPFYGLHSWAEAHGPWKARVHLVYGLRYTKGFMTNAVGELPAKKPTRYLDHPQLHSLLDAGVMAVLGVHTWSLRAVNIVATIVTLLLFLRILRGLVDDKTALLAGLLFCLFPLIGYFGVNMWLYPFCLWGIWNYLVMIKGLREGPEPTRRHKVFLFLCLFMILQLAWEGFFFALGIGVHYVCRCIYRRTFPDKFLLTILIIAPLSSLALDFVIMAAGYGWDYQKIIELYKWRAGSGEMKEHIWLDWFAQFWEYAVYNFTLPVLIIAIAYLTFGQLFVFMANTAKNTASAISRRFPQFWLFFMPPVFQLFLLKGCLWRHQTWERPFCFLIAIAAALGVMLLGDILKKANKYLAYAAMITLVALFSIYCAIGTNFYYGIRWQSPAKIKMFETLKQKIPPDKYLLSFEDFIVNQHPAKGAFYRPEIAWHLDRDIVPAQTLTEIEQQAKTGNFPYYLIPATHYNRKVADYLAQLIKQLQQRYKIEEYIPNDPGETRDGKFYKASMTPYFIFDLTGKVTPN
jgi:hypothetical protein